MSRFWRFLAVAVCFSILPAASYAATFLVQNDEFYIRNSEAVITGTVLGSHVEETPGGRGHRTITEISVKDVLKGGLRPGSTVEVATLGGALNGKAWIVPGEATFADGEEVLLLLVRDKYGDLRPMDLVLGKFTRVMSTAGEPLLVRDADVIFGWTPSGSEHREPVRREEAFLRFVREVAAGRGAQRDYLAPATTAFPPVGGDGRRNLRMEANFTPTSYSMLATIDFNGGDPGGEVTRGCRWPTFGQGEAFFNSNTLAQAPNGGVDSIIAGTAMWTNDCPSAISYSYGGVTGTTQCLFGDDGVNGVAFNDPCNDVPGTYPGTTSTLAQGSFLANSTTSTVEGEQFWDIVEGNVVVNDGVGNWVNVGNAAFFNAMMTHELGHTLAFRHSDQTNVGNPAPSCSGNAAFDCSSSAIMKATLSTAHTSLQAWDQAAALKMYPGGSCAVAFVRGDLNKDGKSDILFRNGGTGENPAWLMNGTALLSGLFLPSASTSFSIPGTGDFDGDGDADIFFRNNATGENAVWLLESGAITSGALLPTVTTALSVVGVGDVNGDSKEDIVWRNNTTGDNAVWLMNGVASPTGLPLPNVAAPMNIAGVDDYSGDGKADIFFRNNTSGANAIWIMNGGTVTSGVFLPSVTGGMNVAGSGDLNADGRFDLIWRNSATGENAVWMFNAGAATFTGLFLPTAATSFTLAGVGDFNGGGAYDIFWRNTATGQNAVWLMNGGSIASGALLPDASTVLTVVSPK